MLLQRTRLIRTGLALTTALFVAPLYGMPPLNAQETPVPKKEAPVPAPLALTAKTDQSAYKADSAIKVTLTAKNTTAQDLPVRFNTGQRYDFVLFRGKDAKGEKIWQWAKGKMFFMMVSSTAIKPGKSLEYTEIYRPNTDGMPALTPGAYTVVATLKGITKTTPPVSMPTASTTFQVN